jgi:hypothetical protein
LDLREDLGERRLPIDLNFTGSFGSQLKDSVNPLLIVQRDDFGDESFAALVISAFFDRNPETLHLAILLWRMRFCIPMPDPMFLQNVGKCLPDERTAIVAPEDARRPHNCSVSKRSPVQVSAFIGNQSMVHDESRSIIEEGNQVSQMHDTRF